MGQGINQGAEQRDAYIFVRFLYLMLFFQLPEFSAFFVNQMISRDVFGMQFDGLLQVLFPSIQRLAGKAIHQVDADVPEACLPASAEGFDGLLGGVPTVK